MRALVTSRYPDPVLEAEAARQGAGFLLRPAADHEFLEAITHSLQASGGSSADGYLLK